MGTGGHPWVSDQVTIDDPVNPPIPKYSQSILFQLTTTQITAGNAIGLTCTNDANPTKSVSMSPWECPQGCAANILRPCLVFTGLPDGAYSCVATVYRISDGFVVFSSPVTHIVIDTTPPVTTLVMTPSKAIYNAADTNVKVVGTATDSSNIRDWALSGLINETGGTAPSPLTLTRFLNMSSYADGVYSIQFDVHDDVGYTTLGEACKTGPNLGTARVDFTLDVTPPGLSLTPPGDCLKGTVNLAWTVTNNPPTTAIKESRVYVDGNKIGTVAGGNATVLPFNTATVADGSHTFRVEVEDMAGNISSASVAFTTDNTVPTISVTSPTIDPNNCKAVNGPTVGIAFNLSEKCDWTITVDGGTTGLSAGSGNGTSGSVTWTPGAADYNCHTFVITAKDACGNNSTPLTFQLKQNPPGNCDCKILPNLIWRGNLTTVDPWDQVTKRTYRPEILNIDHFTLRDVLNCNNVTIDQNLIIQSVCVKKSTPMLKCGSFVYGPGSGLNTNFDTGFQKATNTNLDDWLVDVAFKLKTGTVALGNRGLLFSPPDTTYVICVQYVIRDPNTGRTGAPIIKSMCWKVEKSDLDIIRQNIEYFSTVAAGRTQKPKITPEVVKALYDALLIPDNLASLLQFETVIGAAAVDFQDWINPTTLDVRFKTGYMIDDDEEPIGCLLIEQAASLLWH